jgi:hypothetical protein
MAADDSELAPTGRKFTIDCKWPVYYDLFVPNELVIFL